MEVAAKNQHRPGQPRSERDAAILKRFNRWMQLPIVISAILPLLIVPESNGWVGVVVGVVTWLVFLVDYVVNARYLEHYWRTRLGLFDLFVVIATAPWFLIPGAGASQFAVLLRLARLARLLMVTKGARRLFERLGRVAGVAAGVVVVGSLVAYHAEHPTNPGFATIGDALWWGIVTLTTVGYGDIVPKTAAGRWSAVIIMITGIAVLGVLAGSLASFFRLDNGTPADGSPTADQPASTTTASGEHGLLRRAVHRAVSCSPIALITSGRPGMPLIARADSLLVVVDLQPRFWGDRLDADDLRRAREAAARAAWLAGAASALGVPTVITEEEPEQNGPTDAAALAALQPRAPVFTKPVFGLADCPDIMAAISSAGRRTTVLAGYETDVCVTHSAVGLKEAGYRVIVAADAVYSPFGAQAPGLARLRDLGFELVHCKGIYYDWVRTLQAARAFCHDNPQLAEPPGFSL